MKDLSARWDEDKPVGWETKKQRLDQKIAAYERARDNALITGATDAKQGYNELKKIKEGARTDIEKELKLFESTPQPVPVTIGQGTDAFDLQLDPRIISGFEDMTAQEQATALTNVAEKITAGKNTFAGLNDRDLTANPPTKEEVAELMCTSEQWLENKAGESFFKNALTIPDPNQKLNDFIAAVPGVHGRESSHVSEPRSQTGERSYGKGVDFYGNIDLPYDLKRLFSIQLTSLMKMAIPRHGCTLKWKPKGSQTDQPPDKSWLWM